MPEASIPIGVGSPGMSPFSPLAKGGAASLSALAMMWVLAGCRGESPEGGAAARDTLEVSGSAVSDTQAGQQPSFEGPAPSQASGEAAAGDSIPEETGVRLSREESAAAYAACRDSVEAGLPAPGRAYWPTVPDTMAPADVPGLYQIVAQVRPDSVSPGAPFLCVVRKDADRWSVMSIQGGPGPPQ